MRDKTSRRGFIGAASVAGAAPLMAASTGKVIGANDRLGVGHIGVGGNGTGMLRRIVQRSEELGDLRSLAVCDVYSRHRERAVGLTGVTAKDSYVDYKELLAREDIDAVLISTPDHWHADMAIDAMNAGKDVYLQKPMTLTVDEARRVADTAKKKGRVLQVGSQHLSDMRYHVAREMVEGGEIGDVLWAQSTYSRNSKVGEWNYYVDEEASEQTIDWKRWIGSAPQRPFSGERFFRWRKYWDYSGGIATDLFYHRLAPLLYSIGSEFPTRVTGSGGVYVQKDREVPDTYSTTIEYPNHFVNMSASMANSAAIKYVPVAIYGHQGTIILDGLKVKLIREPLFDPNATKAGGTVKEVVLGRRNMNSDHIADWISCIRSRKTPRLGPEFGYQVMTAIKLGVDSYRKGKVMSFDATTQELTDHPAARAAYEGDGSNAPGSRYKKRT
jgi:predicted dehydrogenase